MSKIDFPIVFAYSRNKYEKLSITAQHDVMTISDEFGSYFCNGEWTVSYSGRPYHNLALDEAHECVINCRLKQITSWPSYFRLVELSNFARGKLLSVFHYKCFVCFLRPRHCTASFCNWPVSFHYFVFDRNIYSMLLLFLYMNFIPSKFWLVNIQFENFQFIPLHYRLSHKPV